MAWAGDGRRRGDGARGRVTQGIGAPARTASEARAAPPCASLEDVVLPGGFRRVTAPICDCADSADGGRLQGRDWGESRPSSLLSTFGPVRRNCGLVLQHLISALSFRNAVLEADFAKKGFKLPKARKTGTTIAGVVYKVSRNS